jgi:hypothetical protein
MRVDLSDADVIDNHCHGFTLDSLLQVAPEDLETRLTLMGMGLSSSAGSDAGVWPMAVQLTESTTYSLLARRWLAERLGCEPTAQAVAEARRRAFAADPAGYVRALLDHQRIVGLIADEGYPLPPIPAAEFERAVGGVAVHRVVRLEQLIVEERKGAASLADLEAAVVGRLEEAADDGRAVAFKSIIAYRTGLDVGEPTGREASAAFDRWRANGWLETREHAKPVRDRLLHAAADVAARRSLALHIHTGDGDPDIDLPRARPSLLFPFLRARRDQPIVLIHGGHPWSHEAGYIASLLPMVYVDLSVLIPWAGWTVESHLSDLIGSVPTAKLLYGSDQASEPEVFWIAARLARRALERVLGDAVDSDYLSTDEATRIGKGILADNTRALHAI